MDELLNTPAPRLLGVLGAVVLLAACDSTPPPTHHPPPSPRATARPSPTDGACGGPCFPSNDTPFAQASAQLQTAWERFHVQTIPGQEVLRFPALPTASGDPTIAVQQAQPLGTAYQYEERLQQWDDETGHGQLGPTGHVLGADYVFNGPVSTGVAQGGTTDAPNCDYFATKAVAVVVPDNVVSQMKSQGQSQAESTGLIIDVSGPCTSHVTLNGKTQIGDHWDSPFRVVITGHIVHDLVLGDFLFVDGQFRCNDPAVPSLAALCSEHT
ncbi:MAG TPA: hypothetical protein VNW94_18530 [Streptosporangiaceae bacterium]|jgi:hypothetical protein|nr:hypothetical protein [Streptosporangiaceae bacterium]